MLGVAAGIRDAGSRLCNTQRCDPASCARPAITNEYRKRRPRRLVLRVIPKAGYLIAVQPLEQHFSKADTVTRRLFHLLTSRFLIVLMSVFILAQPAIGAADNIDIQQAHLESGSDGYILSADFLFDLNRTLEEALMHGIPLHFTTDVELTRPRWYWFDEKAIKASQTIRLSYNPLTRQYNVATIGSLQQSFTNLEDALSLIKRPSRWLVAEKGVLKSGAVYNVALHMELNLEYSSKPFQVNALNNRDWRLSSDRKNFIFKVE